MQNSCILLVINCNYTNDAGEHESEIKKKILK